MICAKVSALGYGTGRQKPVSKMLSTRSAQHGGRIFRQALKKWLNASLSMAAKGGAALAHSAHEHITPTTSASLLASNRRLPARAAARTGRQARSPHDGSHDGIHLFVRRYDFKERLALAGRTLEAHLLDFSASNCVGSARHDSEAGQVGALLQHQIDLGRRAERKDFVAIRVPRHHVERVFSDGPRGAQNRDFLLRRNKSGEHQRQGKRWQQRVNPVKHAPMAGQQPAAVLHARAALDQRFDQITPPHSWPP